MHVQGKNQPQQYSFEIKYKLLLHFIVIFFVVVGFLKLCNFYYELCIILLYIVLICV